jgi:hypothetical protein
MKYHFPTRSLIGPIAIEFVRSVGETLALVRIIIPLAVEFAPHAIQGEDKHRSAASFEVHGIILDE